MVTEVGEEEDVVGLVVFNPTGLFFHPLDADGVRHHEGAATSYTDPAGGEPQLWYEPGTWHGICGV